MLFNSFVFIFGFLPLSLVLTYASGRFTSLSKLVLTLLSLGFYAWWRPIHLPLLIGSIIFNYFMGGLIQRAKAEGRSTTAWLVLGLIVDLGLLGWFKYANFFVDNINAVSGAHIQLVQITLPLAISFFTFQKIAYLIDSARGDAKPMSFLDFALFAAFYPQLIAGPIVHYKEVVPQIQSRLFGHLIWRNILIGLVIFAIGIFKKVVIADTVALYANPLYNSVHAGGSLSLVGSWLAAITYTFQLYFDFSGYSDMAIGLGRMLGVKLPLNFHSPLRARSVAEYWRRWHMTLQRFIYAYLFQPLALAANRWSAERGLSNWSTLWIAVCAPTMITFILVGAWHGAGWTFVVFGALHGFYICVNEIARERRSQLRRKLRKQGIKLADPGRSAQIFHHVITLFAVGFANVVFRAQSLHDAATIWSGMFGFGGFDWAAPGLGWEVFAIILASALIVALLPNTQQIMRRFNPAFNWKEWKDVGHAALDWTWKPNALGIAFASLLLFLGIAFIQRGQAVFLYFNF